MLDWQVNRLVSSRISRSTEPEDSGNTQMPEVRHSLTNNLFFFPAICLRHPSRSTWSPPFLINLQGQLEVRHSLSTLKSAIPWPTTCSSSPFCHLFETTLRSTWSLTFLINPKVNWSQLLIAFKVNWCPLFHDQQPLLPLHLSETTFKVTSTLESTLTTSVHCTFDESSLPFYIWG